MTFADLALGQTFDWIDDASHTNTYFARCIKVSARQYDDVRAYGPNGRMTVGSVKAPVYHVGKLTFSRTASHSRVLEISIRETA